MVMVQNTKLLKEVFKDHHIGDQSDKYYTLKCECKTKLDLAEKFEVKNYLMVGEIVHRFKIKYIDCEQMHC